MELTILLLFLFNFFKPSLSELEVYQSHLTIVKVNHFEYEFQLKKRENLTVQILPSPTLSRGPTPTSRSENDTESAKVTESEKTHVPLVASMCYYDSEVVKLFKNFLEDSQRSLNISSQHRDAIQRYVNEWDEVISDPTEPAESLFAELGMTVMALPKEMDKIYKLLRISHRVSTELPAILNLSKDVTWSELVQEVQMVEADSGKFFFDDHYTIVSDSMLKLSKMYFEHPWELYPKNIVTKIPIKDLISVALAESDESMLIEAVKWLSFATIVNTGSSAAEWELVGPPYESEEVSQNRSQDSQDLENNIETSETRLKLENSGSVFRQIYLSILINTLSFQHDEQLKFLNFTSNEFLFPGLLSESGATEQSKMVWLKNRSQPSYQNLCNGNYQRDPLDMAPLRCRYDHMNAPWLYLMPAKVEVILKDPPILFFHEVLTDAKIRSLQQFALARQEEGTTISHNNTEKKFSRRNSYVSFLPTYLTPDIANTNKIAGYLTGLETIKRRDGEHIQVNMYQPGGHYVHHIDAFGKDVERLRKKFGSQNGDRMATLMFYLNEVEGGRTTFINLGLSITPEKGGALFWYSLLNNGEIDTRTMHSGCPVISGVKWVSNKWIHYNSQLFKRPCLQK